MPEHATPTAERTLADLVTADPGAARVLERFGLDDCCGGRPTCGLAAAPSVGAITSTQEK